MSNCGGKKETQKHSIEQSDSNLETEASKVLLHQIAAVLEKGHSFRWHRRPRVLAQKVRTQKGKKQEKTLRRLMGVEVRPATTASVDS